MKKLLTTVFLCGFIMLSLNSVAQVKTSKSSQEIPPPPPPPPGHNAPKGKKTSDFDFRIAKNNIEVLKNGKVVEKTTMQDWNKNRVAMEKKYGPLPPPPPPSAPRAGSKAPPPPPPAPTKN